MPLITNLQNPLTSDKQQQKDSANENPGQSPPPERQSSRQMGAPSSGQTSDTDQRAANEDTLRKLPSNPATAPMDPTADAKTRKPDAPLDGL
ncbi:hypothetical protein Dda_9456 [Drechslerella dactyloides]|uniref:Uncharacterized protein n=1 Tax=Drechslerella dactyloides TaxID=74499 RepID=A0AAD6IPI4_DREDA|nr:hypothetical protein Dda_9456 [Drechslerella dactyloides]